MTHSDMKVEVQRLHCSRAARHMPSGDVSKRTSPLACSCEYGPDVPDAKITLSEFRALAWAVANDKARELGWIV
jgi:hypothetical protein